MEPQFPTAYAATALPEILLAVGAMALLMYGVFRAKDPAGTVSGLSVLLLAAAAATVVFGSTGIELAFGDSFVVDPFARFMKVLTLVGSAVTIIMSVHYMRAERIERFEYPILVVLATLGMMMMISANDLIALYMGLELQSLPLYVLAAIRVVSRNS